MPAEVVLLLDNPTDHRTALVHRLHAALLPVLVTTNIHRLIALLPDPRVRLCIVHTDLLAYPARDLARLAATRAPHQTLVWAGHTPASCLPAEPTPSAAIVQVPYPLPPDTLHHLIAPILAEREARLQAAAHQAQQTPARPLTIDVPRRRLLLPDREVRLSRDELTVLQHLAATPGRLCPYAELAGLLFSPKHYTPAEARHLLRGRMYYLQSKIERDPKRPEYLICIRGYGYQLLPRGRTAVYISWIAHVINSVIPGAARE